MLLLFLQLSISSTAFSYCNVVMFSRGSANSMLFALQNHLQAAKPYIMMWKNTAYGGFEMSVPDKEIVVNKLNQKYGCSLSTISRKQIMYQGESGEKRIVVCTPYSKIHTIGKGWFDLKITQVELLDDADISLLVVRLEDGRFYYVDFKELRKMITLENQIVNSREGKHWKFYIWGNIIQVRGCSDKFLSVSEILIS
ncbi:hypothetical protein [Paenibacillus agri]|uniref:Uncharacterized protein n=1 Tax=Paenibacillus agri TaxID=2744309 RepID=A0A850EQX7_9BACL|nr:hypothetical protein [Paenibacillus agri]NUU61112.1 hypothetical protein [Paenibacillus agri]